MLSFLGARYRGRKPQSIWRPFEVASSGERRVLREAASLAGRNRRVVDSIGQFGEIELMDRASVEKLRFDRRLQIRPGWLGKSDHEANLDSLPDVSAKMTTCGEEERLAEEAAATEEPDTVAAPASPPASPPIPMAGDFSALSPFGSSEGEPRGS